MKPEKPTENQNAPEQGSEVRCGDCGTPMEYWRNTGQKYWPVPGRYVCPRNCDGQWAKEYYT